VGGDTGRSALTRLLAGKVDAAARGLLGCVVSANGVSVRLTEVEAYDGVGLDAASHAHRGLTPRNAVMFGPPGYSYVYFVFGMHWCLNVVCGPSGRASAILLRAGEVIDGVDLARTRRPGASDRELARGPARLTQALGIASESNGVNLLDPDSPVRLTAAGRPPGTVIVRNGPRVGVAGAADVEWRFWLDGEPSVSVYRRHVPRARSDRRRD
jgi:DNA-3-methyladenine glycosylase